MKQETLKNKAYKYIKDKIINCEYSPGDFLDEKKLIEEINSSRTPIREALNKIEQENLIKIIPKKGVIVTEISLKDILDIYQLRELIESNAIIEFGNQYSKEKLIKFKNLFAENKLNQMEFYKTDDMFHGYITEKYNNHYISELMDTVRVQNQRLRLLTGSSHDITPAEYEHTEIIDMIISSNYKSAAKAMRKHIELSKNRTLNVYKNK